MPSTVSQINFHNIFLLAPEIVLGAWGLVLLLIDLGPLRGKPAAERQRLLCRYAMAGVLLCMLTALYALVVRFNVTQGFGYSIQGSRFDFAQVDYLSNPDPQVFFGTISADLLCDAFNLLLAGMLALVVWLSGTWSFTENWGEYFALLLWSTLGMMLLTASEELLTLFLTLETMTICLYLLTAFEKDKRRSAEGGLKYFVYGSVSSALFLFGLSFLYGLTGSTRISAINDVLSPIAETSEGLLGNVVGAVSVLLILVGFGFKVAAVPFHQWAPDAYEGAPAPVTAWVATGSKVASFIALMKILVFGLGTWMSGGQSFTSPGWLMIVAAISAASMTYGNFAALAQTNFKRMLAYSSIAHAGYMLVGVAAAGISARHEAAAGAVIYYLIIYSFSNIGAFALAVWLAKDKGTDEIKDLNGLGLAYPFYGTCILLLMLSLIGLPPLAGFFGKLYMFMEALDQGATRPGRMTLLWLVALGLLNSVISAFYYVRVLRAMFLRPPDPDTTPLAPPVRPVAASIIIATVVVLGFGIYPSALLDASQSMALPMLSDGGRSGYERMTSTPTAPPPFVPQPPPVGMASPGGGGPPPGSRAPAPGARAKGATKGQAPGKKKADDSTKKSEAPEKKADDSTKKAEAPEKKADDPTKKAAPK
jgi:NADH-quinone oxidoreductase subunit N